MTGSGTLMTKAQKVKAIYDNLPHLANDDIGLCIYILNRYGAGLTTKQQEAFRRAGNLEHWTRAARLVREKHPELVSKQADEARHKEFVKYKYDPVSDMMVMI